jgi:hypothetical protein
LALQLFQLDNAFKLGGKLSLSYEVSDLAAFTTLESTWLTCRLYASAATDSEYASSYASDLPKIINAAFRELRAVEGRHNSQNLDQRSNILDVVREPLPFSVGAVAGVTYCAAVRVSWIT